MSDNGMLKQLLDDYEKAHAEPDAGQKLKSYGESHDADVVVGFLPIFTVDEGVPVGMAEVHQHILGFVETGEVGTDEDTASVDISLLGFLGKVERGDLVRRAHDDLHGHYSSFLRRLRRILLESPSVRRRKVSLQQLADYFHVSTDYLLGREPMEIA